MGRSDPFGEDLPAPPRAVGDGEDIGRTRDPDRLFSEHVEGLPEAVGVVGGRIAACALTHPAGMTGA
jgi:hypothetical protein